MDFLFRRRKAKPHKNKQKKTDIQDFRAVAATDVGSVRTTNEDQVIFIRPHDLDIRKNRGCLGIVADGMGGHSSGEIASQMAIDIISRSFFDSEGNILEALRRAFEKANKTIHKKAVQDANLKGMGTTCTAVVMLDEHLFLGHVGDSRAYLLKGNQLTQLSSDHTYVQYLLSQGMITQEDVLSHPDRNVITQAMGTNSKLKADYLQHSLKFQPGDKLILCSDGLYEYLQPDELTALLKTHPINDVASSLIRLAKHRGGHDNISVLIVETVMAGVSANSRQTQKINLS